MTNHRNNFNETVASLNPEAATVRLEKIESIVNETTKEGYIHRFFTTFLFPAPLMVSLSINTILRSLPGLNIFAQAIRQKYLLIAIATIFYFTKWFYSLPILLACWRFFHQTYTWSDFFQELWQWQTFQVAVLIPIHGFFAKAAMDGFELTKTFADGYELLRELKLVTGSRGLIVEKATNDNIANTPELLNGLIHQAINALVASGKFSPENVELITRTMEQVRDRFLNGSASTSYQQDIQLKETQLLEQEPFIPSLEESYGDYEKYGDFDFTKDKRFR